MAGTIVANTINTDTGLFTTNNAYLGIAKAWIKYNGATQTINNSFNISSVTRNSTGDYTINFATAMPDANYNVSGTGPVEGGYFSTTIEIVPTTYSTTQFRFRVFGWTSGTAGVVFDATLIGISVFGS